MSDKKINFQASFFSVFAWQVAGKKSTWKIVEKQFIQVFLLQQFFFCFGPGVGA